jgi:hypothetical protein
MARLPFVFYESGAIFLPAVRHRKRVFEGSFPVAIS